MITQLFQIDGDYLTLLLQIENDYLTLKVIS
jgi:hypothetical protein